MYAHGVHKLFITYFWYYSTAENFKKKTQIKITHTPPKFKIRKYIFIFLSTFDERTSRRRALSVQKNCKTFIDF